MPSAEKTFTKWAKQEIERLRTEADVLEKALDKYVSSGTKDYSGKAENENTAPARLPSPVRKSKVRKGHKFDVVRKALRAAGDRGLTVGDMYAVIEGKNVDMSRTTLRTMVWHYKNRKPKPEIIELPNGRYKLASK